MISVREITKHTEGRTNMTNAQIIFSAEQELAEQGVIKYTGREYKALLPDGTETTIKETEPLHTFQAWKSLGYSVKKGQKAVTKLQIWKHTVKKNPETDEEKARMFMKVAAFFSASQVEKIA